MFLTDASKTNCPKFADDEWLATNNLLPSLPAVASTTQTNPESDPLAKATVKDLGLAPVITVQADSTCEEAIKIMHDNSFDQLPVLDSSGRKLVGLVTLGNVLSRLTHSRANRTSPVSKVMFDFSKISEEIPDPRDLKTMGSRPKTSSRRSFVPITKKTPLSVLNRFFEWNSAAVVTEDAASGSVKPVAVVTKVDLLNWILKQDRTTDA